MKHKRLQLTLHSGFISDFIEAFTLLKSRGGLLERGALTPNTEDVNFHVYTREPIGDELPKDAKKKPYIDSYRCILFRRPTTIFR